MLSICLSLGLNHKNIRKGLERIKKIKPFLNKYNWVGMNYSSEKDDRKKFEKDKLMIDLNLLYARKEKKYPAFVSKHDSICEIDVFLFNDSKQRSMALYCSKKVTCIIKRNGVKTPRRFLLLEMPLFFRNK